MILRFPLRIFFTFALLYTLVSKCWASPVLANAVVNRRSKVVSLDFRLVPSLAQGHGVSKRAIKASTIGISDKYQVFVNMGTPIINRWFTLELYSSISWVTQESCYELNGTENGKASYSNELRSSSGTFLLEDALKTRYFDGREIEGDLVKDKFELGGFRLDNFTFGVAQKGTVAPGVLGLGLTDMALDDKKMPEFTGYMQGLVDQNTVNAPVYSIQWTIGERDSATGTLLLGGINLNAYRGHLLPVPLTRLNNAYFFHFAGLAIKTTSGSDSRVASYNSDPEFATNAVLGTTKKYLEFPKELFDKVGKIAMDGEYNTETGFYEVPCDYASETVTKINFAFNEKNQVNIEIPLGKFITRDSNSTCFLNMVESPEPYRDSIVFGTMFHRYVYTVFDLQNNQLLMAPAAAGETSREIVEVSNQKDGINGSGVPDIEGGSNASKMGNADSTNPQSTPAADSKSTGPAAETIVGAIIAGVGAILIMILAILFFRKRKAEREKQMYSTVDHAYVHPMFQAPGDRGHGSMENVSLQGEAWVIETPEGPIHAKWSKKGKFKWQNYTRIPQPHWTRGTGSS